MMAKIGDPRVATLGCGTCTPDLDTKSHVASLFARYAPRINPIAYLAAAQVFPMKANGYVVEDTIDW